MGVNWHSPGGESTSGGVSQGSMDALALIAERLAELTASNLSGLEGHYVLVLDPDLTPAHVIVLDCDPQAPSNAVRTEDGSYLLDEQGNYVTYLA